MSTKTLRKRISLVAVSALGFGLISAIAPTSAFAEATATTEVSAVAIAAPSGGRLGSPFTSAVTYTITGDDTETVTLRAIMTAKPTGSTASVGFNLVGATAGPTGTLTAGGASGNELLPIKLVNVHATPFADDTVVTAGRVGLTPDVVGTYTITVWHDADLDGTVDSNEKSSTKNFVVGTAPTAITMAAINSTMPVGGSYGSLVKVTLPAGTALGANEAIDFSVTATSATITYVNGAGSAATTQTLTSADFSAGGVAWLNVTDSSGASTIALTATGNANVPSLSGTITLTSVAADAAYTNTVSLGCQVDNYCAGYGASSQSSATEADTSVAGAAGPDYTVPLGAASETFTVKATAATLAEAAYIYATIIDSDGKVLGVTTPTGLGYDLVAAAGAAATDATDGVSYTKATFTVSHTFTAANNSYTFTLPAAASVVWTSEIVGDVSDLDRTGAAVTPDRAISSVKTGSSVPLSVTVTDQFGAAVPNSVVTFSVVGRNGTTLATQTTKTTDADGVASFTLLDAPAAGVTSLSDIITAAARDAGGNTTSDTATVNWSATGPVASTVTLVTPTYASATSNDVILKTTTLTDIAAGATGASAGAVTVTATVKDAAGNLLPYAPVAFTISGTGAAVVSTSASVFTTSAGKATASVYGWVAGTYTITATAGTAVGTGTINFAQNTTTEARTISAAVEGAMVTATVKDRFGNPVKGVTVYGTAKGTGYFGAGTRSTSGTTNAAGQVEFVTAGGPTTVTVQLTDPTGVAQSFGQSGAAAGYVGTTAVTASAAGTATTAETGVGAALSAAGVNSAVVEVSAADNASTAADAAAEATDAANAATDAANAAAEAADAATAAAQDAADAVAALSAQVASLISGLKSQLTALTNLVIKIQKKVKA